MPPSEEEEGRVLVEGGAVHLRLLNRINIVAYFLAPVVIGLAFVAFVAFRTSNDLKNQRHTTLVHACLEANERHRVAEVGVRALVVKSKKPQTKTQQEQLNEFIDALVPSYNCKIRVAQQEGHKR